MLSKTAFNNVWLNVFYISVMRSYNTRFVNKHTQFIYNIFIFIWTSPYEYTYIFGSLSYLRQ